jgi:hypothetical protein
MKFFEKFIENELHKDLIRAGSFLLFFGLFMQYARQESPKQCVGIGIALLILGWIIPLIFKNKKLLCLALLGMAFLMPSKSYATALSMPYCNENTGGVIFASQWNANCQALPTWANNQNIDGTTNIAVGGIQTTNLANLSVTDAKIFGITTAGKVNGSAITAVNNIPSGAGVIPTVNLGSGSASSSTILFGNQTWASPLVGPILSVHNTATQALTANTWTQRTFGTVDKDSGSYWASNTYTPLVAGWYLVTYIDNILSSGGTGDQEISIYKNGSAYASVHCYNQNTTTSGFSVSAIVQMNGSSDYIQFYDWSLNTATAQGTGLSYASIVRVF